MQHLRRPTVGPAVTARAEGGNAPQPDTVQFYPYRPPQRKAKRHALSPGRPRRPSVRGRCEAGNRRTGR